MLNNFKIKFSAALLAFCAVFIVVSTADAQTKKRKRTRPKIVAVQLPIIQPNGGGAEIISRADDGTVENRTLLPEPELITPTQPAAANSAAPDNQMRDLKVRVKKLESASETAYDQKQKRLLLNLDILTRAETRAESLRKQYFEMVEKEGDIRIKLDQIENDLRPENIDRAVAFAGTLRPEELRDKRAKNLESEKRSLQNLLTEIEQNKTNLSSNVEKADQLVEKLRYKLEQDIDDSLSDEPKNQ